MEELLKLDRELFVFLNNLGSEPFDNLWLIITKQVYWSPLIIFVFYLLKKNIGWKNLGIIILFLALLIVFTDQITNFFKNYFERLRPCNDPKIKDYIRIVLHRNSFSFFSGHASNSMATTMFVFFIIKKYYKHSYLLFLFPIIFAYSRIYLGLHFPLDIITGFVFGSFNALLFLKLYLLFQKKYQFNNPQ
ncbi:MAG TPA: phosphatase PAP2 family protein [Flavobacterium sp.]|nr:phosphatase PAP2 family protein [Flavobacterium sp.]